MDPTKIKPPVSDGITELSESQIFWGNPKNWPREPTECVFLATAVHDIGEAKFGAKWTFDEPVSIVAEKLTADESWHAIRIVKYHRPDLVDGEKEIDDDTAIAAANELIAARAAEVRPKVARFEAVMETIASACQDRKLDSKTRGLAGGPFSNLDPDAWNTERLHFRFHLCQIDPRDPYGRSSNGYDHQYIFITHESLAPFIDELKQMSQSTQPEIQNAERAHLSPYMVMMLEVIKDWQITPANQHKVGSLEEEFKRRWLLRFGEKLADRAAHSMATMIREIESGQGRAKKN